MSEKRIKLADYLIAEGEDEIKGRHRMIYKIRDVFWTNTSNKLKIEVTNNKYSIINKETNEVLIPPEYDNIFIYGEELFVLYKGGKIGAVRISEHNDLRVQWIANCEYDTMDERYHNLTFTNDNVYVYYNAYTYFKNDSKPLVWTFSNMYVDEGYVFGETDKEYVIIRELYGEQIWQEPIENFKTDMWPSFMFIGILGDDELFYDAASSKILKVGKEKSEWIDRFDLVKPIVINGHNVLNITEEIENQEAVGIGSVDLTNKLIMKPRYDNIKLELKVTMSNGEETVEKTYEIPNGTLTKSSFVSMEDWRV